MKMQERRGRKCSVDFLEPLVNLIFVVPFFHSLRTFAPIATVHL